MSREWALDLDMTGIRLLSREAAQWREVATEDLEEAEFETRMRSMLAEHEVAPLVTVFLPKSQILYSSIPVTSPDNASREIEAALESMTPYAAHEIELDWEWEASDSARVAAVAVDTLDEARDFVCAFDLDVASFSSLAEPEDFPRRPDFGTADDPRPGDEDEASDDAPLVLVGTPVAQGEETQDTGESRAEETSIAEHGAPDEATGSPDQGDDVASDAEQVVEAVSAEEEVSESEPEDDQEPLPVSDVEDDTHAADVELAEADEPLIDDATEGSEVAAEAADEQEDDASEDAAEAAVAVEPAAESEPDNTASASPVADALDDAEPTGLDEDASGGDVAEPSDPEAEEQIVTASGEEESIVTSEKPEDEVLPVTVEKKKEIAAGADEATVHEGTEPETSEDEEPASEVPEVAFTSRRNSRLLTEEELRANDALPVVDVADARPVAAEPALPPVEEDAPATPPRVVTDLPVSGSAEDTGRQTFEPLARSLDLDDALANFTAQSPVETQVPSVRKTALAAALTLALGAVVWTVWPERSPVSDTTGPSASAPTSSLSDNSLTPPSPSGESAPPRGDVAALPQDVPETDMDSAVAPLLPSAADTTPDAPVSSDTEDTQAARIPEADAATSLANLAERPGDNLSQPSVFNVIGEVQPIDPGGEVAAPTVFEDARPEVMLASLFARPEDAPTLTLGLSGTQDPPLPNRPEALATVDGNAPTALELPTGAEAAAEVTLSATDTTVEFGALDGLVPEAAIDLSLPDLATLPPTPRPRDEDVQTAALTPLEDDAAQLPPEPPEDAPVADAAPTLRPTELAASLPETRPPSRPTELVETEPEIVAEDPSETTETTETSLAAADPLSLVRPPYRPASAQEALRTSTPEVEATAQAVAVSLLPKGRPSSLAARAIAIRIDRQREAERALEAPDTSGAVRAALTPPDTAPAIASPRMAIPTDRSVAALATLENAVRLSKINLIGVYGVPSDRRALIRLPSGRYVKVKVGDRVDGGRVADIGDDRLRYTKGGRSVTLNMPGS